MDVRCLGSLHGTLGRRLYPRKKLSRRASRTLHAVGFGYCWKSTRRSGAYTPYHAEPSEIAIHGQGRKPANPHDGEVKLHGRPLADGFLASSLLNCSLQVQLNLKQQCARYAEPEPCAWGIANLSSLASEMLQIGSRLTSNRQKHHCGPLQAHRTSSIRAAHRDKFSSGC